MTETSGPTTLKTNRLIFSLSFVVLLTLSSSGCTGVVQQQTPPPEAQLSVVPNAISFTNVIVGQKSTQSVQISNTGKANLNVTGVSLTGTGFSLSAVAVPFELTPGANKSFTVTFSASSTTTAKATLTITSDAPSSPLAVSIQGTGATASAAWQMTPASLSFPATTLQTTSNLTETLKNTGNVAVTISSITLSSPIWTTSGVSAGTILSPGQQLTFQVAFRPTAAGNVTGSLKVASSSAGASALTTQLAGSGSNPTTAKQHTVTLNWNPSTSVVAGYYVYRGTSSGGPYSLLNQVRDTSNSFADSTVTSGSRYFYVTTAVDPAGVESNFSNEIAVTIPTP